MNPMNPIARSLRIAGALAAAAALVVPALPATEAMAKQEKVACTVCHDKPGSKLLTDRGKYYELMTTFQGYEEIQATYGSCTACHVSKPGSHELTERGRQLQSALADMQGLRAEVMKQHPQKPAAPPATPPANPPAP